MKITINSTVKIVNLNGVPARVWEGTTDSGIKLHCFITRIAIDKDESRVEEFEQELQKVATPSVEVQETYSLRLIL